MMRPTTRGYVQSLAFPVIAMLVGIGFIVDPSLAHGRDLAFRLPAGVFVFLGGAFPALYFLGMSVELGSDRVSKVYFFGLFRESIPVVSLAATTRMRWSRGNSYPVMQFMNVSGPGRFELTPTQVWPADRVTAMARLAPNRWSYALHPRRQHGLTWVGLVAAATVVYIVVLVWFARASAA